MPLQPTDLQSSSAVVRIGLVSAMAIVLLNAFTGSPLLALWFASQTNGAGPMRGESVLIFIVVLVAISIALYQVLKRLSLAYDRATGTPPATRTHLPWNQSLGGDRPQGYGERRRLTTPEVIVCVVCVIAFALFEYWFLFLSCSPIDLRCGRPGVILPPLALVESAYLPGLDRGS